MTIAFNANTINACEDKGEWAGSTHANPDDNTTGSATPIFRQGSGCMQATAAGGADGFWTEDTVRNLPTDSLIVFWIWFSGPQELGGIDDVSIIVADGTAGGGNAGRWSFKADLDLLGGGWFSAVVFPTRPDEGTAPTLTSLDSFGLDVDNAPGAGDVKLIGWDFVHDLIRVTASAQTVTLEDLVTQDISDDMGVFSQDGPNFKGFVPIRLGAAASTTLWAEFSKALQFAEFNQDHQLGFDFIDGTTGGTDFTCGQKVAGNPVNGLALTWTQRGANPKADSPAFTNPNNCDIFRLYDTTLTNPGDVDLPSTGNANLEVIEVSIANGGSGYTVGDDLTGVSGTGTKWTANVDAVSAGVITAISLLTGGDYSVAPTTPDTTTVAPAGGSGATVNLQLAQFHESIGAKFAAAGAIDIHDCTFEDNIVLNAPGTGVLYAGTGTRRAKNNRYIGCFDALTFDTAQTISLDGDQFSGNVTDIHFSGTGTLTVNLLNGANAATSRVSGGGTVVINNAVTLTVTVKNETGLAVVGAKVRIEQDPSGTLVDEGTTNASGVFSVSFNFTSDLAVKTIVRLLGFQNFSALGTITVNGLDVGVTFLADETVDLP